MKKLVIIVLALALILAAGYWFYDDVIDVGRIDKVKYDAVHGSSLFTDEEINSAIEAVKKKFLDFEGCTLTEIHFDEEKSKAYAKHYVENGKGSQKGITENNVLVLLSSFTVDETGGDGSLNAGGNYTGWNWILIRDSEDADWVVDDWGY